MGFIKYLLKSIWRWFKQLGFIIIIFPFFPILWVYLMLADKKEEYDNHIANEKLHKKDKSGDL